jgi:hypothetical protein
MESEPNETASGGGKLRGLDPSDPKDQAMIRSHIQRRPKRWAGITPEVKAEIVTITMKAARASAGMIDSGDPQLIDSGVRGATSAAKTLAMIEGQNQADEHLDEKHARLDAGLTTENVALQDAALLRADPDARAKALEVARMMTNASSPNIHT